jgi:hypothetical protein
MYSARSSLTDEVDGLVWLELLGGRECCSLLGKG